MRELDRRTLLLGAAAGAAAVAFPAEPTSARGPGRRALRQLARSVRGRMITPGERGYGRARLVYNARIDRRRPDAIVEAVSPSDVRAAVEWAGRHDVPIVPRSGGHSYAGYSTSDSGIVIDLGRMREISVARRDRRARIEAGCQLIDVYARLARAGATVPAGSCPSVGIGGLALGGGYGLASRALGLTCDNVLGLTIVTADGRQRRIDRNRDPDLFWACRGGGGGNFGIVTSFDFRLHRAERAAWFQVTWPWGNAERAIDAWQELAPEAPPALTSVLALGTGGPTVSALGQFFGSEGRLRRLIRPLARVGGASISTGSSSYLPLQLRWAGCLDEGLRRCHTRGTAPGGTLPRDAFFAKSDYVARPLSGSGRRRLVRAIERRQRESRLGSGAILLDAYGGAINRVGAGETAFVHRDQLFSVQYLAYYGAGSGSGRRAARRWVADAHDDMRAHVSGEAYQNYIDPDLRGWREAYYGRNYPRLVEVKTAYDPDDRFRFRQGIRPRSRTRPAA